MLTVGLDVVLFKKKLGASIAKRRPQLIMTPFEIESYVLV